MNTDLSSLRIIVIDDDRFMVSLSTKLLNKMGIEHIDSAFDGKEALEKMGSQKFDIALLDLNMPGMDGIEFIRDLAKCNDCVGLVLMSGENKKILASASLLAKAHNLNVLGVYQKPIRMPLVEEFLENYVKSIDKKPHMNSVEKLTPEAIISGIEKGYVSMVMQPQVRMKDGRVVGVEALVRWQEKDQPVIGPEALIPVAEEHGLMTELIDAILDETLSNMSTWGSEMDNIKVSINVSMDNLKDVSFADRLMEKAANYGIHLKRLVLEVTETKLMADILGPLDILSRMRMKGVGISLDDFGTGASSYENLQRIPFTELKIDRCFVDGASKNEETREILTSIFNVAKKLDLAVVAEGVEEKEDWELLAEMGCDMVQGYYFSRPMPCANIVNWVKNYHQDLDLKSAS